MAKTPGKSALELARGRREEFMKRIGNDVAVFPAAPEKIRNNDVEHEYRQDSDLYYLTCFEESCSAAVLSPAADEEKFVLFVNPKDREREVWTGWRTGTEDAVKYYGADAAFTIDELEAQLNRLSEKADTIYYRLGIDRDIDAKIIDMMRRYQAIRQKTGMGPFAIVDPAVILHEMRLVKSREEIGYIRRAVDITAEAQLEVMKALRPGMFEYQVEGILRYFFLKNGSFRPAFPPITASGPNATVLHYSTNDRRIESGDLIVVDAGAEYEYYAGDITRTLPASGRFTKDQAALYEVVLDAGIEAIKVIKPGVDFIAPHNRAVRILTEGMVKLGLLDGDVDKLIEEESYKKYYMHRTSHWLGMDVHDVGLFRTADDWRKLEPGMVLTIEPGIYIAEDLEEVDSRFRGMGIRIEDDVLVTETGCETLSARVPKTIEEIEALMGSQREE